MKTNKTKPIKKLMIFTIITVMIVSLFAVPAFADDVQSLSNTDVVLNTKWTATSGYGQFNVNGYYSIVRSNGSVTTDYFRQIDIGYDNDGSPMPNANFITFHLNSNPYIDTTYPSEGQLIIHFTGGDDIANSALLSWLQSNGVISAGVVWDEKSGYLTPIELPDGSSSLGWYAIQLDADDIIQGMNAVRNVHGDGEFTFNVFGNNTVITNGYILIDYVSYSDSIVQLRNGSAYAYFKGSSSSNYLYYPGTMGSTVTALAQDINNINSITFIVHTYPPLYLNNAYSTLFWDTAVYSVYEYTDNPPVDPDDPTPPADGEEQGIFAVWSKITQWIVQGLASVSNAFYADGKLTLLGTLCIIPLALGLAFLLIGIIQKFLRLRG